LPVGSRIAAAEAGVKSRFAPEEIMRSRFSCFLVAVLFLAPMLVFGQAANPQSPSHGGDFAPNPEVITKVPQGVILVKGAWPSASDSVTPVPEGGSVTDNIFRDQYFGMTYELPPDWEEKYKGPPPSDSGRYVLAQLRTTDNYKGPARAIITVTADDMFFTPFPAANALELVNYSKNHLQADYKIEMPPTPTKIAGRPFTFFASWSPIAELHWYVAATEIRCHAVEFILNSRDTKLLSSLVLDLDRMKLPAEISPTAGMGGGSDPLCIKDYANGDNVIARVEPIFSEHRFNAVPVRIIIDKEGKVKHIHFLRAFPDQAKAVTDALGQWRFKRYLKGGKPVEVETGLMFGRPAYTVRARGVERATE
jgi:hypothetical protein